MADPNETRSRDSGPVEIASYRKRREERARIAGIGPEHSRDIYQSACAVIGAYLQSAYGFRYAKSGPHARRRSGAFVFQIRFQSSFYNVRGEHAELSIHPSVHSPRLKAWRAAQPLVHPSDWVASGLLGPVGSPSRSLTWNLADPGLRDDAIREAIQQIDDVVLPHFARFEDLRALLQSVMEEDVPTLGIRDGVELLLCFADRASARRAGAAFLRRHHDWPPRYRSEYERLAASPLGPERIPHGPERLAFASHLFELGDLSSDV